MTKKARRKFTTDEKGQRLWGYKGLPEAIRGVKFKDDIVDGKKSQQEVA